MKVAAPGKLVLSGAYAVLEGAPALVSAIDRYAVADTDVSPSFYPPEVLAAMPREDVPYIDVSRLWQDGRKLGMGSSAAVVVSAVAARIWRDEPTLDTKLVQSKTLPVALQAHRQAQGGGSGIDVAASTWGGTVACQMEEGSLVTQEHVLPGNLQWDVYWAQEPSSTPHMLAKVRDLAARQPSTYQQLMDKLKEAAEQARWAKDADALLTALSAQARLLARIGDAADAPIVPALLRPAMDRAWRDGVVVIPSGAGGGDIVLAVGARAGCENVRTLLRSLGLKRLAIELGAVGVHLVDDE